MMTTDAGDNTPRTSPYQKSERYETGRFLGAIGLNWFECDTSLQRTLRYYSTQEEYDWAAPHLVRIGALMGGPIAERADETDKNPPRLVKYDRWGQDISRVDLPESVVLSKRDYFANRLANKTTREEAAVALTASMVKNLKRGLPIHQWKLADLKNLNKWEPTSMLVEEFMTTDLFTVQQDDIPELVADIMDWQKIRFTPIEDDKGKLIGLISARILLRHFTQMNKKESDRNVAVKDLMNTDPRTIEPEATIQSAMKLMRQHRIGCLPVIENGKLVGIITAENFISITASLLNNPAPPDD